MREIKKIEMVADGALIVIAFLIYLKVISFLIGIWIAGVVSISAISLVTFLVVQRQRTKNE